VATGLTGDKFSSDKDSVQRVIELVKKLDGKYVLSASGDLTLINIDGAALTVEGFDLIVKQTELETLQVANFRGLNDAAFTKITGLKKLKTLAITNAIITDASVALIAKSFPLLRNLDLSRNALLTDDALSSVGKLKELESLLVNYCTFSEFGLMSIEKMPKLRTLDIRGNVKIDGSGLGVVAKISSLRALKHRSEMVDDNAISELAAAKNLEIFDMQDFAITDAAGEELKKLPKLSQLIIFRCLNFGSQGLLALKGKALTRLTLRDLPSLDDTGMEAFRELTALKRLYLHELNSVTDVGMMNLVYLKNLETLDIWSMSEITDKSIESIAKLQNLKNISIRSTKITDKSIDLLLSLPKLQELTLKDNASITKEAKTKLKEAKKIKTLILN
jgi:Leucine-rich repeat (LRR) protein